MQNLIKLKVNIFLLKLMRTQTFLALFERIQLPLPHVKIGQRIPI